MTTEIQREIRLLKGYAAITTALLLVLLVAAFRPGAARARFTEIDVERINVVEPDGALRMVISNRPRSIGPIYKGTPFGYPGGTRPGMIFFNDEGTENGGLTFTGSRGPDGRYRATSHFAFDQFDQDQVLYLQYVDDNGRRRTGLTIADRADVNIFEWVAERDSINRLPDGPEKQAAMERLRAPRNGVPLVAQRVYLGRDVEKNAVLALHDAQGRARIRMLVDSLGAARLEFLDDRGRITNTVR
jgi:hypothetical protein